MFTWDADNRRFVAPSRCPWPDCGQPVEPTYGQQVLCWCRHCERPYEATLLEPADGGPSAAWNRRPEAVFCTLTGAPLRHRSPLDWGEAGGDPGRSGSLDDARGAVFGTPRPDRAFTLHDRRNRGWWVENVCPEEVEDEGDLVSALCVVRGRALAVTLRGRMSLLDPQTGARAEGRPLVWPSFPPPDPATPVLWPPAARGTRVVLTSPREAQFRDLAPQIFPGVQGSFSPTALVRPRQAGAHFHGPPLGIDAPVPLFCLLEGVPTGRILDDALLRFFELDGTEVGRCPAPGIARPPVWDARTGQVVWITREGFVSTLHHGACRALEGAAVRDLISEEILDLAVSPRPTAVLAPDLGGEPELWVADVRPDTGELGLDKAALEPALARGEVVWTRQWLGRRGDLVALSVGRGPGSRANAAAQMLAVATDQAVLTFPKALSDAMEIEAARGHEGADRRGTWDAPVVTSAGVLARVPGALCLLGRGLGWAERAGAPLPLPVRYAGGQGLAVFGRRVLVGIGLGVRCFVVEPEEVAC